MSDNLCVRCGRPMADQAYVCPPEAQSLAESLLRAAGHAEDAEAVIARQARYGGGGRGGSSDGLTYDETKSAKFGRVRNTIGTWVDDVRGTLGEEIPPWRPLAGALCPPTGTSRCPHASCDQLRRDHRPTDLARDAAWLAAKVDWLRKRQEADQAFGELTDACDELERLVDRPADRDLVGMCDCGKTLYAVRGRTVIQCPAPTCKLVWHVERSREILRRALDDKLFTAAEAAPLAVRLDGGDRSTEQVRKLIGKWAERGEVVAKGNVWREPNAAELEKNPKAGPVAVPLYRFGDVADRLARTPRRNREGAAA